MAPYATKQMRVPEKLEPQIHKLIDRFRSWIANSCPGGIGASEVPQLLDESSDNFTKVVDKLKSELEEQSKVVDKLKVERDCLDQEVNQLHSTSGELHLRIAELEEQLKSIDKLKDEMKIEALVVDPEALILLKEAVTPKSKGGSYAANNATGLKKLVEQALVLLKPIN